MGTVKVSVIRSKGKASLVEYIKDGGLYRCVLPENCIDGTMVNELDLEAAISYGIDWEGELDENITIRRDVLINSLHEYGVWTYSDFVSDPNSVIGALHAAFGMTFQTMAAIAKRSKSNDL